MDWRAYLTSLDSVPWWASALTILSILGGLLYSVIRYVRWIGKKRKTSVPQNTTSSPEAGTQEPQPRQANTVNSNNKVTEKHYHYYQPTSAQIPNKPAESSAPNQVPHVSDSRGSPAAASPPIMYREGSPASANLPFIQPLPPIQPEQRFQDKQPTVEQSPQSGGLSKQYLRQRRLLRRALWSASCIEQEMKIYANKYRRQSQSEQAYQNHLRLHKALLEYLRKTEDAVADLNQSLNSLDDNEGLGPIEWLDGDPRLVFFASVDPFGLIVNRSNARSAFVRTLSHMIETVKRLGYTVELRKVNAKNPGYLKERAVWQLTKAPNAQIESSAVSDDELSDAGDEEAS